MSQEVVGLHKKSRMCKICNAFNNDMLNKITLDILLHRRTYKEICTYYTEFLPRGIKPINEVNVNNHRKHCDPALIAEDYLKEAGIPTEQGDTITALYGERYKERMSKVDILHELYRERISNMEFLQKLLDAKRQEYDRVYLTYKENEVQLKKTMIAREIKSLIKDIDDIQGSMQNVLVKDISVENGSGSATINVYNNVINVLQGSMKSFMGEMVPYLLLKVFADNPEFGKLVIKEISSMMDRNLSAVLVSSPQQNLISSGG